jgi:hypothetical protein
MRSKLIILFTLTLTLLIGSGEMTMSFDLVETSAMERSEEVPSRESEEHASVISSRVIRPLVLGTGSNIANIFFSDSGFRKLVVKHSVFFKSSLHILFLSLRH